MTEMIEIYVWFAFDCFQKQLSEDRCNLSNICKVFKVTNNY